MIIPRANPDFVGHSSAVAALHGAAASGRLHHAWLIGGQSGIGKTTLAYRFARWLLAGATTDDLSVNPPHPVFTRVAAGTHPDLLTIERRYSEKLKRVQSIIAVDTIREIKNFFHLTPADGGWRIVVVEGAEDMTPSAQNALLKMLEEPPKQALLILVTDAPGSLLATTRSRCRTLQLAGLSNEEMRILLQKYAFDLAPKKSDRLIELAEGSIGAALTMASAGVEIADLAESALDGPVSPARAQQIADSVARTTDGNDRFDVFFTFLRRGLAASTRKASRNGASSLGRRVTLWEDLGKLEREVQTLNLDKRAAIIVALSQLHGT